MSRSAARRIPGAALLLFGLVPLGCKKDPPPDSEATEATSSSARTPRIVLSQQPWYQSGKTPRAATSGLANRRATKSDLDAAKGRAQGEKYKSEAEGRCKADGNCRFSTCSSLCSGWVNESAKEESDNTKNVVYLGCIAGCAVQKDGGK